MASVQIFRSHLKTPFILLLVVETSGVFFAVYSASLIRFYAGGLNLAEAVDDIYVSALTVAFITAISLLSTGLYYGHLREGMAGVLIRVAIGLVISSMVTGLIFYILPNLSIWRGVLAITYIQSFFVIGTLRAVFLELVDAAAFKKRILLYGAGLEASHIDKKLRRRSDRRGFNIIGYVLLEHQVCQIDKNKLIDLETTLLAYATDNQIDEIVVASNDVKSVVKVDELVDCKLNGISVLDLLSFFEREVGQIRIDIMDSTWLVTTDGFRQTTFQNFLKRFFDLVVSSIILIVTIPVQILIVFAIWLEDGIGAQIVYRQERVGEQGKIFSVYKYRSMIPNAESKGEAVWANQDDSRITRTGAFLRKFRLDELPQVINVIKGEMSFVGPRPERPEFVSDLTQHIPYYMERHVLKPGLTGWAQLNYPYGASLEDAYQKQLYDMYYVKNRTLFLDCLILLQTVEVVLFGKGAR